MITIYGKDGCGYCIAATKVCTQRDLKYEYLRLDEHFTRDELLTKFPNAKTFPQIEVNTLHVGGYNEFVEYLENTGYNGTGYTL